MKSQYFLIKIAVICLVLHTVSCTTDDILPAVGLSVDETNLSEDNGVVTLTATLNISATEQIVIPISISGTATASSDYTISASEIVINSGANSGSITITGVQDTDTEGPENLTITLSDTSNFLVLSTVEILLLDDDSDSDGDGVLDANDNCPNEGGEVVDANGCPVLGLGFIINEVHYDPAANLPGDANGDGTRSPLEDEFIEFFNSGSELDISGYTVSDSEELRHTFPAGTILPINGVIVLFGGGAPTGSFGGALVQTASEGQLNMSNSGDFVTIMDAMGNVVITFDIEPLSNNPDESYTRNPDLTGDFVQHTQAVEGVLFSPGTKIDGSSF
jgi:hypothetical protein